MSRRVFIPAALAAVAALSFGVIAQGAEGDKVTGGGQTLVGDRGAGDTIAFVAMQKGAPRGQVQYVDREANENGTGTGRGQVVYHGTVTCVEVTGNTARIAGAWTVQGEGDFEIFVEDNGQGSDPDDMIFVDNEPVEPNCQEDDGEEDNEPVALARGNVTVHNQE